MTTGTAEMDAAAAASRGLSGAVKKKNILAFKRMLADDDDSSDDEPPKFEPKAPEPGNETPAKKAPKAAKDKDVKVRSERLQLRAAIIESTTGKSDAKKPSTPRKRQRASSESPEPEKKERAKDKSAPKRVRLTRKDSRETLKKKRQDEKAHVETDREEKETAVAAQQDTNQVTAPPRQEAEETGAQRGEQAPREHADAAAIASVRLEADIVPKDTSTLAKRRDANAKKTVVGPLKEKERTKRQSKDDQKEKEPKAVRDEKDTPAPAKRRSRAISEDDVGNEPTSPASELEKVARATNGEDKKRKRLKRPLSEATASENGSHDRKQTSNETAPKPKPSKRLSPTERRDKTSGIQRDIQMNDLRRAKTTGKVRRGENNEKATKSDSLDDFLKKEKKSKAGLGDGIKVQSKKPSRGSGSTSLDDYMKQHKKAHESRNVPGDDQSKTLNDETDHAEGGGMTSPHSPHETTVDIDSKATSQEGLDVSEGESFEDLAKREGSSEHTRNDAEVSSATARKTAEEGEEVEEEDGAVSDHENGSKADASLKGSDEASKEEPAADPLSFVIPKKRVVAENLGQQSAKKEALPGEKPAPLQPRLEGSIAPIPMPSPSPVFSVDMSFTPANETVTKKPRKKNVVPPKLMPLTQREKDFMRLAKKTNSLLKAATVSGMHISSIQVTKLSAFGCTSDRYGVLLESGSTYSEPTTRMACPTRKKMQDGNHTPDYFGVAMKVPPCAVSNESTVSEDVKNVESKVPCYETLDFDRPEDRAWYQKRMYGTPFVPQLLRERITLVMRNARYVRKSAGLQFNMQRDKEEYETQLANRYKMNSTTPRCDILYKNWQLLSNGRTSFVFLHYMNREDALLARARFRDDDGQPLIIKGESRANELAANGNTRAGISPGLSPPPQGSPQPRRRSRSGSNSRSPSRRLDQRGRGGRDRLPLQRQAERGPRPPRDRSRDRGGRRPSFNGPEHRNGGYYGPRSPCRRPTRSRSRSPTQLRHDLSQHDRVSQPSVVGSSQPSDSQDDKSTITTSQPSQESHFPSQASNQEHSLEEGESLSQEPLDQDSQHPGGEHQRTRGRSRSRSRPRLHDERHPPLPPHSMRRGSEDRSFHRDRRNSGEFFGRAREGRRGRSPPPPPGRDSREHGRYNDHYHQQQHHDDWQPHPRDFDRYSHHDADPHRRSYQDGRRFH